MSRSLPAPQQKSRWRAGFSRLRNGVLRLLHRHSSPDALRRDLEGLIDAGRAQPKAFDPHERRWLRNVLRMRQRRVEDVMTPRAQIEALPDDAPLDTLLPLLRKAQHSRLPVYRETLDNVAGLIHVKDVLRWLAPSGGIKPNFTLAKILRTPLFVPPSMSVPNLLRKMQAGGVSLALVADEHGGTCGLVSVEDLVEEIVGEIEDEHDRADALLPVPAADGGIEADALTPIAACEGALGRTLALPEKNDEAETIGALAMRLAGRVPKRGETISHPAGVRMTVRVADPRRIKRLHLALAPRRAKT